MVKRRKRGLHKAIIIVYNIDVRKNNTELKYKTTVA